ncbi:hypothetical protein H5410_064928 [Solanum commersonii]|uniref:Uncharacterized protein n=1 Tax=Solanum commersonii TaxID=4109 RepID=A0A9J5VXZ1_SOLCO|nr:hypothetical protein H5410_064928 [Solanum commersonii]
MEMWQSETSMVEPRGKANAVGHRKKKREIGEGNCPKNPKPKSTPTPTQESTIRKKRGRGQYERASGKGKEEVVEVVTRRGLKWLDKVYLLLILDIHQGLSSNRRVNTGVVISAHVTGDIGFKPTKGLKWKGKHAMTQRELQVQSVMRYIQTRSKVAGIQTRAQARGKSPSKKTS